MNKHKIIAVVKTNGREALVLEKPIELNYTKYDDNFILGTDGVFVTSYYYERPGGRFYAFAGRKFDLPLTDGTVEHCFGQWWDGRYDKAEEILNDKVVRASAQTLTKLKDCYVFIGYWGIRGEIEKLRATYTGKVYEYWEYDLILRKDKFRKKFLTKKADYKFKLSLKHTLPNEIIDKAKKEYLSWGHIYANAKQRGQAK